MSCPHCPHCAALARSVPDPIAAKVAELREWCEESGHAVYPPDDRVRRHTAAALLGRASGTLRNWSDDLLPRRRSRPGAPATYLLADIARRLLED